MMIHRRWPLVPLVLLAALWLGAAGPAPVFRRLPNGLEVVVLENHSAPVVATYFVVKIGVRGEDAASCGMSHMLEHLLFNGTEKRSQEQLYEEADLLGAYNNAFTREDYTCYLMVAPRENFAGVLELQADMIFHSVLPAEKLEKERGIVLEELAKDRTSPEWSAEQALQAMVFGGTPYALPTLGTEESIKAMPRELIQRYYQAYYVPNNITLLVVGDVAAPAALELITARLGGYATRPVPAAPAMPDLFAAPAARVAKTELPAGRIVLTMPAPAPGSADWPAFDVARRWLEDPAASPLAALVKAGEADEFACATLTNRDYSLFQITFEMGDPAPRSAAQGEAWAAKVRALAPADPPAELLRTYQLKAELDEIYNLENIHYLGMWKGQLLADLPLERLPEFFGDSLVKRIQAVAPSAAGDQARRLLGWERPLVAVLDGQPPDATGKPAKPAMPKMPPR
jgi:zinc protease